MAETLLKLTIFQIFNLIWILNLRSRNAKDLVENDTEGQDSKSSRMFLKREENVKVTEDPRLILSVCEQERVRTSLFACHVTATNHVAAASVGNGNGNDNDIGIGHWPGKSGDLDKYI
jgi:hypothetical protein